MLGIIAYLGFARPETPNQASPSQRRQLPCTAAIPPDLTAKDVSFQASDGIVLHGTILEPATATAPRPGIVLVHGSGVATPRTRLMEEATAFARQGLAVLIYDKRSVGYTLFQRSYSQLADDALGAIGTLRAHRRGPGEGGHLGPQRGRLGRAAGRVALGRCRVCDRGWRQRDDTAAPAEPGPSPLGCAERAYLGR